jgi:hypothetical protein
MSTIKMPGEGKKKHTKGDSLCVICGKNRGGGKGLLEITSEERDHLDAPASQGNWGHSAHVEQFRRTLKSNPEAIVAYDAMLGCGVLNVEEES